MTTLPPQLVSVGLGELKTATDAETPLVALGLGSCVAIALFDPRSRIGGLVHVVLPAPLDGTLVRHPKFATNAVPMLLETVTKAGASHARLICKIAGGAQVLTTLTARDNFRIGERNIESVLATLAKHGIRPQAADTGGNSGRSMRLTVRDGRVAIKRLGQDWKDL